MDVIIPRQEFVDALSEVASVIPARSPKPILQSVRIEADADEVVVIATDLDVSVRRRVPGVGVNTPGVAVIPAAKLRSILSTSDDAEFRVKAGAESVSVQGSRSKFSLPASDPAEYPVVADFGDRPHIAVESRHLLRLIRRAIFAVDEATTQYALYGVYFRLDGPWLWAESTDRRRLTRGRIEASPEGGPADPAWSSHQVIIPAKGLRIVSRSIDDGDPPVHIALVSGGEGRPSGVLFRTERSVVYSRMAEGRFPDLSTLHRPPFRDVSFPAHSLRRAVEHASVFTSEVSLAIDFTFGPDRLTLSGNSADVGSSNVELDCLGPPAPQTVALYPGYFVDPLKTFDAEDVVTVGVAGESDPVRISLGEDYEYIVMPMTRAKS